LNQRAKAVTLKKDREKKKNRRQKAGKKKANFTVFKDKRKYENPAVWGGPKP